jgi:hypothetical protein
MTNVNNATNVWTTCSDWWCAKRPKNLSDAASTMRGFFGEGTLKIAKGLKYAFCNIGAPAPIKLGLCLAGVGLFLAAATSGARTFIEGNNALRLKGNHYGSIKYSAIQTGLHAINAMAILTAFLVPPLGALALTCPALFALPSGLSLGMDYFQDVCTNPNNFINNMGQIGLNNSLLGGKIKGNNVSTFRTRLLEWWDKTWRAEDKVFVKSWFGLDIDRPKIAFNNSFNKPLGMS